MDQLPGHLSIPWRELWEPDLVWQLVAITAALSLAWLFARWAKARLRARAPAEATPEGAWETLGRRGRSGVARIVFPLSALALVHLAQAGLKGAGFPHTQILTITASLLTAMAVIRVVVYVLRQAFASSGWLAASERAVAAAAWGIFALNLTGLLPQLIDLLEGVQFAVGKQQLDLWMILHGLMTVGVTLLIALWAGGIVETRVMAAEQMDSSLRVVLVRLTQALLTVSAVLVALSLVGIDLTTLSVFGGALAVGLGFGLQKIASNYVSGFIILLDRSIRLGNVVRLDATTQGVVSRITTRYTVLRSLSGIEFIVPNEYLVGNIVQNQTFTDSRVRLTIRLQVAYNADVEAALATLERVAKAEPRVLADPAPLALVIGFGDSGIDLELGFWIADPDQGTGGVSSNINRAIIRTFREAGIEIPYPQREVRLLNPSIPPGTLDTPHA